MGHWYHQLMPPVLWHFSHSLCLTPMQWRLLTPTPLNEMFNLILQWERKVISSGGPDLTRLWLFHALVSYYYNKSERVNKMHNCLEVYMCVYILDSNSRVHYAHLITLKITITHVTMLLHNIHTNPYQTLQPCYVEKCTYTQRD